jgi:hypothetical protein
MYLLSTRATLWKEKPADASIVKQSYFLPRTVTQCGNLRERIPFSEIDIVVVVLGM